MSDSSISLADWVVEQIGKGRPYRSNNAFADAAGIDEKTVRRIRDGEPVEIATLRKMANGLKYPIEELVRMAGILEDDAEVQDDTLNYIIGGIKRLKDPKDLRSVRSLIRQLLDEQERSED